MPMNDNPANLRQQARAIASKAKSATSAWSELKTWATGKGPLAMKSAAEEFMAVHGRSPEAAILLPEAMHSASWGMSPAQRQDLLIGQRPSSMLDRSSPTQFNPREPKEMLPLSIFFRPKQKASGPMLGAIIPLDSQHDPVYLKDAQFRMRGAAEVALPKPSLGQAHPTQKSFDASRSPDSFHMGVQGSSGGEVLRSLVERMRSHGRDDFTISHSMPMRDAPEAKSFLHGPDTAKTAKTRTSKPKSKKRAVKAVRKAKQTRKTAKKAAKTRKSVQRAFAKKTTRKARATKARSRSKRLVKRAKRKSRR
ncbi:hypothetical protein H0O00_04775 [Candidatus Micrarchaeota archaeon]|nr:hypothetical protein [Candidatus Micrarchaeota archaeon]